MKIELQPGDPRLGQRGDDGLIEAWPTVDVFGNAIVNHVGPSLLRVGRDFVLVPVGVDATDLVVEMAGADEGGPVTIDVTATIVDAPQSEVPVEQPPAAPDALTSLRAAVQARQAPDQPAAEPPADRLKFSGKRGRADR